MKLVTAKYRISARRVFGGTTLEILLTLLVAYFMGSAGISWISNRTDDRMDENQLRQLAHQMVNVTETARYAGIDLIDESGLTGTIERISQGAVAKGGPFKGQFFGVPDLGEKAKRDVAPYLEVAGGRLAALSEPRLY